VPGPGDDDGPHLPSGGDTPHQLTQLPEHGPADRVAAIRPVDGPDLDGSPGVDLEFRHIRTPSRPYVGPPLTGGACGVEAHLARSKRYSEWVCALHGDAC